jgi:TolA-binding protein
LIYLKKNLIFDNLFCAFLKNTDRYVLIRIKSWHIACSIDTKKNDFINKYRNKAMSERSYKKMYGKKFSIKAIWIILSATLFIFVINGCAGMRSVRGTKAYYKEKNESNEQVKDLKTEPEQNELDEMLSEFETKFHKTGNNDKKINDNEVIETSYTQNDYTFMDDDIQVNNHDGKRRLPTLSEQMESLSNGQLEIKDRVDYLQNDVNEMKGTLSEIKEAIYEMSGTKPLPKTGLPTSNKSNTVKTTNKNNNIILPDEEVKEQKSDPKPQKAKRKTNTTKTVQNKTFTVKPANYIAPDKNIDNKQVEEENQEKPEEIEIKPTEKYDIAFNHFKNRRFNEAVNLFNDIVNSDADPKIKSDSYYWLGESYFGMEQYGKAIDHFNKVSSAGANSKLDNAQMMIAECLIRSGQVVEAKTAFKELIAKYPDSSFVPRARKMLQQL